MNWRFWEWTRKGSLDECTAIEPLLSLYSDGMASSAEARRVQIHLPGCPECQQALRWMQATQQVIVHRPIVLPPPDLRARIARAIAEAGTAKAPAVQVPARVPARRPLTLRPALAYGLSFGLLVAVTGGVFWNAAHRPARTAQGIGGTAHSLTPNLPPTAVTGTPVSSVVNGVVAESLHTFSSALRPSFLTTSVHPPHHAIVAPEREYVAFNPPSDNSGNRGEVTLTTRPAAPRIKVAQRPSPFQHESLVAINRMAIYHPTYMHLLHPHGTTMAANPTRHTDNPQQMATNVTHPPAPSHEVVPQFLSATPQIRIGSPIRKPDEVHVAMHIPSLSDVAGRFNSAQGKLTLATLKNSGIRDATAILDSGQLGTVKFVGSPIGSQAK